MNEAWAQGVQTTKYYACDTSKITLFQIPSEQASHWLLVKLSYKSRLVKQHEMLSNIIVIYQVLVMTRKSVSCVFYIKNETFRDGV